MSYLSRIQARSQSVRYSVMPKGVIRRAAQETPEEEQNDIAAQPLRRQADENTDEKAEETAQALHRQENATSQEEEQPTENMTHALHRQTESATEHPEEEAAQAKHMNSSRAIHREATDEKPKETAQALRRSEEQQEEEPAAAPLRRENLEHNEEEAAQMLRRNTETAGEQPEEETAQPRRSVEPSSLTAENSEQPEDLAEEPTQPDLTALHREIPQSALASAPEHSDMIGGDAMPVFDGPEFTSEVTAGLPPMSMFNQSAHNVQIDQIDVLIQEPSAPVGVGQPRTANQPNHSIRTRYLRRL